jgi:uncharacterized membrane protein
VPSKEKNKVTVGTIFVLLHILSGGWFASGLIGRNVTWSQARNSASVEVTLALLGASDHFDRLMVIPGSMVVLVLGLIAAWQGGWPILGFIEGADSNWLLASLVLYLSLVPFIPLYLAPRRKARNALVERARAEGALSPELIAALNDPGVLVFRRAEFLVLLVVTVLMVTKPF